MSELPAEYVSPKRSSRAGFWLGVGLLGFLFTIGACALTWNYFEDRGNESLRHHFALQVVFGIEMYRYDHGGKAAEGLEDMVKENILDKGYLTVRGRPWHYFRPPDPAPQVPVVILVSPRCDEDGTWLRKRRVVGWSDGRVALAKEQDSVALPAGRSIRLSELP